MKAKLYKGPFSGRSYDCNGQTEIVIRGDKPMSRRAKWEYLYENQTSPYFSTRMPQIEARYRMAMYPIPGGWPMMHPDGSYFYQYIEGSKREF